MKPIMLYLWDISKRKLMITFLVFLIIEAFLLWQMNVKLSSAAAVKQEVLFIIALTVGVISYFLVSLQIIQAYGKSLKNPLLRLTPMRGKQYIYATVFLLSLISIIGQVILMGVCYIASSIAIPQSGVGAIIKEIWQTSTTIEGIVVVVVDFMESICVMLQLILFITIGKILIGRRKLQVLFIVVGFLIFNQICSLFSSIFNLFSSGKIVILANEKVATNETFFFTIYKHGEINVYNLLFVIVLSLFLIHITARIIDKKIEV